jgi:hypothetical protein
MRGTGRYGSASQLHRTAINSDTEVGQPRSEHLERALAVDATTTAVRTMA